MAENLEIVANEVAVSPEANASSERAKKLCDRAIGLAPQLVWLPNAPASSAFAQYARSLRAALQPVFAALDGAPNDPLASGDFRWLWDNVRLLHQGLNTLADSGRILRKIPKVRDSKEEVVPRIVAVAEDFLEVVGYEFKQQDFVTYVRAFQDVTVLTLRELWGLVPAMKLVLLRRIAEAAPALARNPRSTAPDVAACMRSLSVIAQTTWKEVLESLILFDRILREDPAGAYPQMDFESRDLYRTELAKIAASSEFTESEVAHAAVALAEEARQRTYSNPRVGARDCHVGYYLVDKGLPLLHAKIGFHYPLGQRIQAWLRSHADEYFLPGIGILSFVILSVLTLLLTPRSISPELVLFSMLMLLLPCSQGAVQLMNYLTTAILPANILPKLDFSEGVPEDCVTMVAIPTLLLNEKQVRGLVEDLEVRFLGNRDPNLHFALLSDLPDSREPAREDSSLIDLCAALIGELNERYAGQGKFLLLHRHRVYNPQERVWMGWERKRGKLLDLNRLILGQYDSFPVKVGDLSVLGEVRFVITLDSDTELPRGAACRMIGALAHPLNQAIIDPEKNIVTTGYGILQPRVGVSVQSTAHSRLAAIYAGETGFDIYTRAVSDAYQDLYGEGSYTGKGIYEVATLHQVLDRRFPRNALLSHDLIEGAYARAGLASDIEVIEDYPSHYSAYNRRKHRWLRGDWQILEWLFAEVPEESGSYVRNPISLISWWKILDNMRRSLVEPATFALFVFGWLQGASPAAWTLAAICIVLLPSWFEFVFRLIRAWATHDEILAREAPGALYASNVNALLTLTFLPHQALVSLDAVVRALVRRTFTRQGMLEWETAAEAEAGGPRRTPVDVYLDWMPAVAVAIGLIVWFVRPSALLAAFPVLLLWAISKLVATWLNRPSIAPRAQVSRKDTLLLRRSALHTWRYFAEFSTEEHNWLIPDNVQEEPPALAARLSPTNLGLLLNARQVACEFGYLTAPELVALSQQTLTTMTRLRQYHGHLLNWYDTRTLQPLSPFFVSSVDSGNLLASLWTLQQGCLERLRQPMLQAGLAEGFLDYLRELVEARAISRKQLAAFERERETGNWLQSLLSLPEAMFDEAEHTLVASKRAPQARWFATEARRRREAIRETALLYAPWSLPEFAALRDDPIVHLRFMDNLALEQVPDFIDQLERRLTLAAAGANPERKVLCQQLCNSLPAARGNVTLLVANLRKVAATAGQFADAMDFEILLNPQRKLMSVGLDSESEELSSACYDLLATESRTAVFVAIAKDDIPQETWFLLGRAHTLDEGRPVLLSWTGTIFEYLMPALWMRSYPNTLLERSQAAVVASQQAYGQDRGVPWGISESSYYQFDEARNYKYHAFGVPPLALHKPEFKALVISPYSTFLALNIDPAGALENLRRLREVGAFGPYGYYEAADYTSGRSWLGRRRCQIVRCWMAHHQGMSLLALANFLHDNVAQRWFHRDRRVQATELLLHEKPVAHVRRGLRALRVRRRAA